RSWRGVLSGRFLFLFLASYRYHLDPHSFPTRRSSDLTLNITVSGKDAIVLISGVFNCTPDIFKVKNFLFHNYCVVSCNRLHYLRSEEHTSELQSRENLVCRLLLEKKKEEKGTIRMQPA